MKLPNHVDNEASIQGRTCFGEREAENLKCIPRRLDTWCFDLDHGPMSLEPDIVEFFESRQIAQYALKDDQRLRDPGSFSKASTRERVRNELVSTLKHLVETC